MRKVLQFSGRVYIVACVKLMSYLFYNCFPLVCCMHAQFFICYSKTIKEASILYETTSIYVYSPAPRFAVNILVIPMRFLAQLCSGTDRPR